MTTAALLQATSVLDTPTVVSSAFAMGGAPGGVFDATPTSTIVSTFAIPGVGAPTWITEYRAIASAVLSAPGVGTPALVGQTIVTVVTSAVLTAPGLGTFNGFTTVSSGIRAGDLTAAGNGAVSFHTDAQGVIIPEPPPVPIPVRFTTGPKVAVIPVEIVNAPGPDVLEVRTRTSSDSKYTNVVVDPTHPLRKKIHFTE